MKIVNSLNQQYVFKGSIDKKSEAILDAMDITDAYTQRNIDKSENLSQAQNTFYALPMFFAMLAMSIYNIQKLSISKITKYSVPIGAVIGSLMSFQRNSNEQKSFVLGQDEALSKVLSDKKSFIVPSEEQQKYIDKNTLDSNDAIHRDAAFEYNKFWTIKKHKEIAEHLRESDKYAIKNFYVTKDVMSAKLDKDDKTLAVNLIKNVEDKTNKFTSDFTKDVYLAGAALTSLFAAVTAPLVKKVKNSQLRGLMCLMPFIPTFGTIRLIGSAFNNDAERIARYKIKKDLRENGISDLETGYKPFKTIYDYLKTRKVLRSKMLENEEVAFSKKIAKSKLKYNDEQLNNAKSLQKSFFIGVKNNTENREKHIRNKNITRDLLLNTISLFMCGLLLTDQKNAMKSKKGVFLSPILFVSTCIANLGLIHLLNRKQEM